MVGTLVGVSKLNWWEDLREFKGSYPMGSYNITRGMR